MLAYTLFVQKVPQCALPAVDEALSKSSAVYCIALKRCSRAAGSNVIINLWSLAVRWCLKRTTGDKLHTTKGFAFKRFSVKVAWHSRYGIKPPLAVELGKLSP